MPDEMRTSGLKGLVAGLGRSAEYSIALALIGVCLVAGGALWLLDSSAPPPASRPAGATAAAGSDGRADASDDEQAALADWKRQLQGDFSEIEQQQQRRAAEEKAARERQRLEEERAARERQRLEQLAAAQRRPAPAPVAPPPPPVVRAPPRAAVRTEAAIDWTSCRRPDYPQSSIRRQQEGVVAVAVDLDAAGRVLASRIAESSGHTPLDLAAQRAIEKCRFKPGTLDGLAQASSTQLRFTWQLQD